MVVGGAIAALLTGSLLLARPGLGVVRLSNVVGLAWLLAFGSLMLRALSGPARGPMLSSSLIAGFGVASALVTFQAGRSGRRPADAARSPWAGSRQPRGGNTRTCLSRRSRLVAGRYAEERMSEAIRTELPAADPSAAERYLLLADISGYTGFMSGVEQEHGVDFSGGIPAAYGVLADLLNTVIEAVAPDFTLVKLEGDAVFAAAPAATLDGHGDQILEKLA